MARLGSTTRLIAMLKPADIDQWRNTKETNDVNFSRC